MGEWNPHTAAPTRAQLAHMTTLPVAVVVHADLVYAARYAHEAGVSASSAAAPNISWPAVR
jgi:hypothetical protein